MSAKPARVEEIFERAAQRLLAEDRGTERGRVFHSEGLKTAGKLFAFVTRGELVVKLPAERVTALVAEGTGLPFDANRGRPMKEWVRLRPSDEATCRDYMAEARSFVAARAKG